MALAQKYDTSATTKTHGLVDASITDLLLPSAPLDGTGNMIRAALHAGAGYLLAKKQTTGAFFS